MLHSKSLILAKIESPYGTDPTPTALADSFVTSIPEITPLYEVRARNVVQPSFGMQTDLVIGQGINIKFQLENKPHGSSATTAPKLGIFLRACGFTQTIDTTIDYNVNSSHDGESVTIYYYKDGVLHKALGCVGTFKLSAVPNDKWVYDFDFTGLYSGKASLASDVAFPSATYTTEAIAPILFRSAGLIIGAISGLVYKKFEFDMGNNIIPRLDGNSAYGVKRYSIAGRNPKANITVEAVALSTFDPWSDFETPTARSIVVDTTGTAGKSFKLSLINAVPDAPPQYSSEESVLCYDISYKPTITPPNADGDVQIIYK